MLAKLVSIYLVTAYSFIKYFSCHLWYLRVREMVVKPK